MPDAKTIINLALELEDRDSDRNAAYDTVLKHYGGNTYGERKKNGTWGSVKQGLTELFSTRSADEDVDTATPINLVRPTIHAKIAWMGLPPTIRVPEPPLEDANAASEFADNLEKCLLGHWHFSNMARRCYDMAWYQGAFGAAVVGVWPDFRYKRPRIFVRSPQYFYPITYDEDGMELQKCLWVEEEVDGKMAAARYGNEKLAKKRVVKIIQYIDEGQMCVVADGKMVTQVDNPMGLVPVVCIGNLGIPGSWNGDTDVGEAIPIAKEINYRVALADDMAAKMLNPTVAVTNPLDVPDEFELGQGGRITMGERGKVELLFPPAIPQSYWDGIQLLQQWFDQVADNPAALRSEGFGSILTGKGFNALLSPLAARLQIRRSLIDPALEQVNRYTLEMWDRFPHFNKRLSFSGTQGKDFFQLEFEPDDFKIDGKLWTENEVFLSSNSFIDRQGEVVELMQLYQNELISWDTVMEYNPYVRNKARERWRIEKDREWKAQGMAMAQQMAQSPATANPDLAEPEQTAYGLERGMMGETPTPQGAEAQMPAAAPVAQGEATPDVVEVIVQAFAEIPKLKGQVWLGGDILLSPESVTADGDWTITVWLENPADKATIVNYLRKNIPELYDRIEFHVGEPSDEEPSIPVGETPIGESAPEGLAPMPQGQVPEGVA